MTIHELALSNENIREIEVNTCLDAFGLKVNVPICLSRLKRNGKNITFEYHASRGKYVYPTISVYDNIECWEMVDLHTIKVYLPFKPTLSESEIKILLSSVYGKVGTKNGQNTNDF